MLRSKSINEFKVAAIFDEFTKGCFKYECDLITFTPENWKEVLSKQMPDFLMVESAWEGNNGSWTGKIKSTSKESIEDLEGVIRWCKENNIPTVFWNKEDPIHYSKFINAAKMFDYIFTTDSNMIPAYKRDSKHSIINILQFAAQPTLHNPISIGPRENAISFAGSFYPSHKERSRDMLKIFNQAIPYGLVIFDRNYNQVKMGKSRANKFPKYLTPYIRGGLKYDEINKAYKGFRAMINVNTVKNSPTMFARRIFEGLACGTPVISTYSKGVEKLFGDIVCTSKNELEIFNTLENIFKNEEEYRRISLEGIRRVLSNHTYSIRLETILKTLGFPIVKDEKYVTVISKASTIEEANQIINSYTIQSYKNRTLCLIVDENIKGMFQKKNVSVSIFTLEDFKNSYKNIIKAFKGVYIAYMDENTHYKENHLLDLMLATQYTSCEIIGVGHKETLEFKQVSNIDIKQCIIRKDLLYPFSYQKIINFLTGELHDMEEIFRKSVRVLSITTN